MSLFSTIKDAAISTWDFVKSQTASIFHADVQPAMTTFLHVLEQGGGSLLLNVAATVLQDLKDAKFGELTQEVIARVKADVPTITEDAAKAALTVMQTHLDAQAQADASANTAASA